MDSDSYTPAIPIDELTALAKLYGPGNENNPEEFLPGIDRWENEGGSPVDSESDSSD